MSRGWSLGWCHIICSSPGGRGGGALYINVLTLILVQISNYIHDKMLDEIIHQFPKLNIQSCKVAQLNIVFEAQWTLNSQKRTDQSPLLTQTLSFFISHTETSYDWHSLAFFKKPVEICGAIIPLSKLKSKNRQLHFGLIAVCVGQCCFIQELYSVTQNKVWCHMNRPLINSPNTNKIYNESRGRARQMSDFQ